MSENGKKFYELIKYLLFTNKAHLYCEGNVEIQINSSMAVANSNIVTTQTSLITLE